MDPRGIVALVSFLILLPAFLLAVFKKNKTKLQKTYLIGTALVLVWCFSVFAYFISNPVIWKRVEYTAICFVGVVYLILSLIYSNNEKVLTRRNLALLFIPPGISLIIVHTNQFHHLFFRLDEYRTYARGSLFWFLVGFSYLYLIVGLYIFISYGFKEGGLYKKNSVLLAVGTAIPFAANIIYIFKIINIKLNITLPSFAIYSLILYYIIFKYKFFDILPIALRKVVDSLNIGILVINSNNQIVDTNDYAKKIFSKYTKMGLNESLLSFLSDLSKHVCAKDGFENLLIAIESDNHDFYSEEILIQDKQERQKYFKVDIISLMGQKGYVSGKVLVFEDITEIKETQFRIQDEKMTSLEQLAAALEHEINNPLGALQSNLDFTGMLLSDCLRRLQEHTVKDKESIIATISKVIEANKINKISCNRVTKLMRALKEFVNLDEAEIKSVDINANIETALLMVSPYITPNIEIIKKYGKLPSINCFSNELNQAFFNILKNACEATQGGGEVLIKTEVEGDYISVSIKDTGSGIDERDIDKVFNPGFTSKGVKVGTGFGLSMAYRIVDKHQGIIKIQSKKGQGTNVSVRIPLNL